MGDALEGLRVLDLSRHMAAPYGTVMLADFGAEVIKVESAPFGDPSRRTGTAFMNGVSGVFLQWNRNKRSIALELRRPEAMEVVHDLVRRADVLVESYRPGVADEIGVGYEAMSALNPRLIYCSVSAFGPTGPLSQLPGTDPVVQAMSGVMSLTGERGGGPVLVGVPVADFAGAMALVQGVLLALVARMRTRIGQKVEVPMLSVLLSSLTTRLASYLADGVDPVPNGSAHSVVAPYQMYATSDGQIVAGAWAPEAWPRFCDAIGRHDLANDERFADNPARMRNYDELDVLLAEVFATRTTQEWAVRFEKAGALFGEVCTVSRILEHAHVREMGIVQAVEHPVAGPVTQIGPTIELSDTPGRIRRPPPLLGEHTREILTELGHEAASVADLIDRGIAIAADETACL